MTKVTREFLNQNRRISKFFII